MHLKSGNVWSSKAGLRANSGPQSSCVETTTNKPPWEQRYHVVFEGHQHLVLGEKPIRLLCFLRQNQEVWAKEIVRLNLPVCFLQLGYPTFHISLSSAASEYRNFYTGFHKPQNKVAGANQAWWLLWEGSTHAGAKQKWTWPLSYEIQRGFPEITVDKVQVKRKKKKRPDTE